MKKIKILLAFGALFFVGALVPQISYARKPSLVKTTDMIQLNKVLKQSVKPPDFTLNDEESDGVTSVIFSLTNDGKIRILKVTAPSQRLENYIKEKFSTVSTKDMVNPTGMRYQVKIRFDIN